jgi:hypothetical protein
MSKAQQRPSVAPNGIEGMSATTKESFDAMSRAFSGWLGNANRIQSEAIRFLNDRFNKDIEMMSQFANCKKPEEFFNLQAKIANNLVADYTAESTRLLALLSDATKEGLEKFSEVAAAKHSA